MTEITRDALGRLLISEDQRIRIQALEMACHAASGAANSRTGDQIVAAAKKFESYIKTGQ